MNREIARSFNIFPKIEAYIFSIKCNILILMIIMVLIFIVYTCLCVLLQNCVSTSNIAADYIVRGKYPTYYLILKIVKSEKRFRFSFSDNSLKKLQK